MYGWLLTDIAVQGLREPGNELLTQHLISTWKIKNIFNSLSNNRAKEVVWKATHRVLTTWAYIASWGMAVPTRCPFCPNTEDAEHVLVECHRARRFWSEIQQFLDRINGSHYTISMASLRFPTVSKTRPASLVTQYLLHLGIGQHGTNKSWTIVVEM